MGHHYQGAPVSAEGVGKQAGGEGVEVVRGLVHDQAGGFGPHREGQGQFFRFAGARDFRLKNRGRLGTEPVDEGYRLRAFPFPQKADATEYP